MTVSICKPCAEYARELGDTVEPGMEGIVWTCWMFGGGIGCANPVPYSS